MFTDFMLDDHRLLRVLREFHEGRRDSPMAYDFLAGDGHNAAERLAGVYPWWMTDELKYRHLRPTASWLLYGQYALFGERAIGFRVISLSLYAAGVLLVLRIFRMASGDERRARWAALAFALMAGHVIPVVFISAQCDLVALVAAAGVLALTGAFVRGGGAVRLGGAALLLVIGLGAKEAMLPVSIAPAMWWLMRRRRAVAESGETSRIGLAAWRSPSQGPARRTLFATAILTTIGLAWLVYYTRGGYGANTLAMMDPLGHPRDYLAALPRRAVLLLGTWLVPLNPFLLEITEGWRPRLAALMWLDLAALAMVSALFLRRFRRVPGVGTMALWPIFFLPILACTPPDDRVMVLPSIGLAYLSGAWLAGRRGAADASSSEASRLGGEQGEGHISGDTRLLKAPLMLFVWLQILAGGLTMAAAPFTEWEARRNLRVMADEPAGDSHGASVRGAGVSRATAPAISSSAAHTGETPVPQHQPWIVVLNTRRMVEPLFMQDRFNRVIGPGRVAVLCDVGDPKVTRVDDHTLRIEATSTPLLTTYLGMMGTPRSRPRQVGDVLDAGEYEASVTELRDGEVHAVEIRFREALDSGKYQFWWSESAGPPTRRNPGAGSSQR